MIAAGFGKQAESRSQRMMHDNKAARARAPSCHPPPGHMLHLFHTYPSAQLPVQAARLYVSSDLMHCGTVIMSGTQPLCAVGLCWPHRPPGLHMAPVAVPGLPEHVTLCACADYMVQRPAMAAVVG